MNLAVLGRGLGVAMVAVAVDHPFVNSCRSDGICFGGGGGEGEEREGVYRERGEMGL